AIVTIVIIPVTIVAAVAIAPTAVIVVTVAVMPTTLVVMPAVAPAAVIVVPAFPAMPFVAVIVEAVIVAIARGFVAVMKADAITVAKTAIVGVHARAIAAAAIVPVAIVRTVAAIAAIADARDIEAGLVAAIILAGVAGVDLPAAVIIAAAIIAGERRTAEQNGEQRTQKDFRENRHCKTPYLTQGP